MNYVNAQGALVSDSDFRAANPLVSFPAVLSQVDLQPYGLFTLKLVEQPTASAFYSNSEGAPIQVDGVWTQTWTQNPIPLDSAQAMQGKVIDSACAAAIVSGFTSSALGTLHTYPSKMTDQQNLTASVLDSVVPGNPADWTTDFWCAGTDGVWAYTPHTAVQIQQAGRDGKTAVRALQTKCAGLQAQIAAATTVDAVSAIVWTA